MKRKTLCGLAAMALGLTLASCSDTDIDNSNNNPGGGDSTQVEAVDTHEALSRLLGALADVDSLPDNWNQKDYVVSPTIGVEKDASNPHVRYVAVNNAAEADRLYCSYTATASDGEAHNHEWKVDGIGSLQFEVKNQTDLYATLKVDVQQLPQLEEVQFVPASALGENGWLKPKGVYYSFGDVVRKRDDGGRYIYWVCVRPCSMTHNLRKTYWASLQTTDEVMKAVDDMNVLPTKLCSNKSEGERMVQNFFNVLRFAAQPSQFQLESTIDKITAEEFNHEDARIVSDMWSMEGIWSKIVANHYRPNLQYYMMLTTNLNAFYYGYSKVLVGKGDYRLYNLNLKVDGTKQNNKTLFNVATPSTPYIYSDDEHVRMFANFAHSSHPTGEYAVYIDSYGTDDIKDQFLVRIKSGAELEESWRDVDVDPSQSFGQRDNTLEDVLHIHNQALNSPFFAPGDMVGESKAFTGNQLCFYNTWNDLSQTGVSYFVCKSDGQRTDYTDITINDDKALKSVLYLFYRAVDFNVFNPKAKYTLYRNAQKEELTTKEYEAYTEMLKSLYSNYLKGRVQFDRETKVIRLKLNGKLYSWDPTSQTVSEDVEDDGTYEDILVMRNTDVTSPMPRDNYSVNRSLIFGLTGLTQRNELRYGISHDVQEHIQAVE